MCRVISPKTAPLWWNLSSDGLLKRFPCPKRIKSLNLKIRLYSALSWPKISMKNKFHEGGKSGGWDYYVQTDKQKINVPEIYMLIKCHQPGHGPSSQDSVTVAVPGQDLPPCAGAGLLHWRVRVFVPSSHVTLQSLQVGHAPQLPFTGGTKW